MNKAELCAYVAEQGGLTRKEAERLVTLTLNGVIDALTEGERVQLVGFGTFEVRERAARTGRDMKTGEPVQVAPSKAVVFRPGKLLKDAVKGVQE